MGVCGGATMCRSPCSLPDAPPGDYNGQGIVIMLIAIAHAAAVEDHGMIEQRAVAVFGRTQFLNEIGQQAGVIAIDQSELIHAHAVIRMMRRHMEPVAHAALRINCATGVARIHHGRDARDVRLKRQSLQVEHDLEVVVERFRNPYGSIGHFHVFRRLVLGLLDAPLDLAYVVEVIGHAGAVGSGQFLVERCNLGW